MIDPQSILFSVPTLSDDVAPCEPITQPPSATDFLLHEDEWSQIEFFSSSQLPEIQRLLNEYKPFEQTHRVQNGWRQVYVRKIRRVAVIQGAQPLQQLESMLGLAAQAAPVLFSSGAHVGRVQSGFTFQVGTDVTLYGHVSGQSIPVLGAHAGANADTMKLIQVFTTLNAQSNLVLVDWRAQQILTAVTASGQIEVWKS